MAVRIELVEGVVTLDWKECCWLEGLGVDLVIEGQRLSTTDGGLQLSSTRPLAGEDELGSYHGWSLIYRSASTELVELRLKAYSNWAIAELEALQELEGTAVNDSFLKTTFNLIFYLPERRFLLYTWGLRQAGEPGRWPEARSGESLKELPEEPFAPLILWDEEGAVALAPFNYFLTGPLRSFKGTKPAIARGLHGAVEKIPRGLALKTILAFAPESDPFAALYTLGDLLLQFNGKERPGPLSHPILKWLGYWNDYGAYYSELFTKLDEERLLALANYFQTYHIPIGYFGLDLWYPYVEIGRARKFCAQREKYPRGLGQITRKTGFPFLLHLSALSRDHEYKGYKFILDEQGACPAEQRFYQDLARKLKDEGALGVWHDWLWFQQEIVKTLRTDPQAAEQWFAEMVTAFAEEGLVMMLCMPTMGFHLASTQYKNIIAARSYYDYLNKQPKQVELAQAKGLSAELLPAQSYIKQNILVGLALHALGLQPFYDVFITNATHPEGFAEPQAEQEALLRALGSGVIGIGDKLDCVDQRIIERLTLPDGRLAKPDRPPRPLPASLEEEILIAHTETAIGGERWVYLLLANVDKWEIPYRFDPALLGARDRLLYDCLKGQLVSSIEGELPPAGVCCFLLAPRWGRVSLLGIADRYVPLPHGLLRSVQPSLDSFLLQLEVYPSHIYPLIIWGPEKLAAEARGGRVVEIAPQSEGLSCITVEAEEALIELEVWVTKA